MAKFRVINSALGWRRLSRWKRSWWRAAIQRPDHRERNGGARAVFQEHSPSSVRWRHTRRDILPVGGEGYARSR